MDIMNAFSELANGNFEPGLAKLNEDSQWHDDGTDLDGPFRLKFPGARGWGEELLVASLLKRNAAFQDKPVKVYASPQVCSILRQDPYFDAFVYTDVAEGRSPLPILRQALMGTLLEKPFIPLCRDGDVFRSSNHCPRIGIAWASMDERNKPIDQKSVPVNKFLTAFNGVRGEFVSFQRKNHTADPEKLLRKLTETVVPDEVLSAENQNEVIERIRQLDCLVTISTTTTHIAASLGVKVELLVANRKGPQWFWQVQANHQRCFYPTVRLHLGNGKAAEWWKGCLESVRSALVTSQGQHTGTF